MKRTKNVKIVYGQKKKSTAVLLAVLCSLWTFLYSYREDYTKFWILLVMNLCLFWTLIVPIGIWVYAMVEVCGRPKEWYENY